MTFKSWIKMIKNFSALAEINTNLAEPFFCYYKNADINVGAINSIIKISVQ